MFVTYEMRIAGGDAQFSPFTRVTVPDYVLPAPEFVSYSTLGGWQYVKDRGQTLNIKFQAETGVTL
jgi:hypothetical protein